MNKIILSLVILCVTGVAQAADLSVSAKEPIVVTAPDGWASEKDKRAGDSFPFETYRVVPPGDRNAVCLISIYDKDKPQFLEPQFLQTLLRGDSRPYVSSPEELPKVELKELKLGDGQGYYVNFVDPDLVGKPVKPGSYKTATPIILSLGSKYLIKVTLLCDAIDGADYKDALAIVESMKIKRE